MKGRVLEVLVEEHSAGDLLKSQLPAWLGAPVSVNVRRFSGKPALLQALPDRLRGYARLLSQGENLVVLVLVDRDTDDCLELKSEMEQAVARAGLHTRMSSDPYEVCCRIAVMELEAWYYGDWAAVRRAYPRLPRSPSKAQRHPDTAVVKPSISFQQQMRQAGYRGPDEDSKRRWAERIGPQLDPDSSGSASFRTFIGGARDLVRQP